MYEIGDKVKFYHIDKTIWIDGMIADRPRGTLYEIGYISMNGSSISCITYTLVEESNIFTLSNTINVIDDDIIPPKEVNQYDQDIRNFFKPTEHKNVWAIKRN